MRYLPYGIARVRELFTFFVRAGQVLLGGLREEGTSSFLGKYTGRWGRGD
jgi:hypothetical protein